MRKEFKCYFVYLVKHKTNLSSNIQFFIYFKQSHTFTTNCQINFFNNNKICKCIIVDTFIFKIMKKFIMSISKTFIYDRIYFSSDQVLKFIIFYFIYVVFTHLLVANLLN